MHLAHGGAEALQERDGDPASAALAIAPTKSAAGRIVARGAYGGSTISLDRTALGTGSVAAPSIAIRY
jgi:hypothetical protein